MPLILRLTVNVGDLRRQTNIMADERLGSRSTLITSTVKGQPLKITDMHPSTPCLQAPMWRVGAKKAPHPQCPQEKSDGQPPPGMTTALKAWNPRWATARGLEKNRRWVVTTGRVTSTFDR